MSVGVEWRIVFMVDDGEKEVYRAVRMEHSAIVEIREGTFRQVMAAIVASRPKHNLVIRKGPKKEGGS